MARANKYTSINFNDIYEKQLSSSSSSSAAKPGSSRPSTAPSSYSAASSRNAAVSNYKSHLTQGRMLVLSRPSPKPIAAPFPPPPAPAPDPISLRPLGRTGGGSPLPSPVPERDREAAAPPAGSPKPNRFVPPHLRPGFAGREERPEGGVRVREPVPRQQQQQQGPHGSSSPGRYAEDRPKSGGYDRMRRGGESDLGRASSFGARPSSSG